MKKMRKLVPAFAMLMVAAIMMSTASFAWFSMSASVDATGMQVKAVADGGLVMSALIATADGTPTVNDYVSAVQFGTGSWYTNGAKELKPTSTNGTKWFSATADTPDNHAATTRTELSISGWGTDTATYYLATKLFFMGSIEDAQKLTVKSITATAADGTSGNLNKAIRIAMRVDGTTWYYFAPNHASDATGLVHTATTTTTGDYTNLTKGTIPTSSPVVIAENLVNTDAIEVEVYVYYEGEDPNCKSTFAIDISTLDIAMTFGAVPPTP